MIAPPRAVRERMGTVAFDDAVSRVAALPLDDAVTLALATLDELLAVATG